MNLDRLRRETREDHEATESALPLMAAGLTMKQYASVLERLHRVVGGWEQWAQEHAPADLAEVMQGRQRAGLIRRDLETVGGAASEEPMTFPAWRIAGLQAGEPGFRASFLGAMYVMEGSTLGGQFIARHLEEVLGLQLGEGDAYFRGYGERTGEMWRGFKGVLSQVPDEDSDAVIAAAKQMFRLFGDEMALHNGAEPVYGEFEPTAKP